MKTKQCTSKITHGSEEITMNIRAKYHENYDNREMYSTTYQDL